MATKNINNAEGLKPFEDWTGKDVMTAALNGELSAYEEGIKINNDLIKRLNESACLVTETTLNVIDAMGLAYDQKQESIDKLRSWRKTIEAEKIQAIAAIDAISRSITKEKLNELREFVEIAERLNKIDPNILLGRLMGIDNAK